MIEGRRGESKKRRWGLNKSVGEKHDTRTPPLVSFVFQCAPQEKKLRNRPSTSRLSKAETVSR